MEQHTASKGIAHPASPFYFESLCSLIPKHQSIIIIIHHQPAELDQNTYPPPYTSPEHIARDG